MGLSPLGSIQPFSPIPTYSQGVQGQGLSSLAIA